MEEEQKMIDAELQNIVAKEITKGMTINDFTLMKVIGVGSYGKVMQVRHKETGELLALKMLRKEHIAKRNQVGHTKTERYVLETIRHPFIVKLRYAFQNPKKLYFVLDYCPGGELFFHLQKSGRFDEDKTRFYAAQLVLAIEHLHKHGIIYRDLKPENVLIDRDGYIKITDFGLSKENITDNQSARSFCGTPEYLAPEILKRTGHGRAVDWWSLGAIIFEMLTGLPPFYTKDREKLFYNIKFAELKYPNYVSAVCKDLLSKLFIKDPEQRAGGGANGASDIKQHPWFIKIDWEALENKGIKPPFKPNIAGESGTNCFDPEFTQNPAVDSASKHNEQIVDAHENKWEGFTYEEEKGGELGGEGEPMQEQLN
eukprot:TRINITY_DN40660_c0_g1_i1.p1 TRINITY_DN40660_c0_g1~~TRINITY_DN40660_c0_g1_i1.p1  ORF type:complete len:370 (-),score=61.99 TRINITY_DN40660_c0_g1_i1:38-1147(-)